MLNRSQRDEIGLLTQKLVLASTTRQFAMNQAGQDMQ